MAERNGRPKKKKRRKRQKPNGHHRPIENRVTGFFKRNAWWIFILIIAIYAAAWIFTRPRHVWFSPVHVAE